MHNARYTQRDLGTFSVDSYNNILRGVALASVGEAEGHHIHFDETTLSQIAELLASSKNKRIKARFGHPPAHEDPLGTQIGFFHNARIDGDKVIADFVATPTPHNESLIKHVFGLAESGADLFGISIEASVDYEREKDYNRKYVRILRLEAAAFVSDPAANADGLFNAKSITTKSKKMKKKESWLTKAFKKAFAQFAEAELPDGQIVRFPGDAPAIGDPVMVVEDGEEVGAAPDGDHEIGGLIVTTVDGVITAIRMPDDVEVSQGSTDPTEGDLVAEANNKDDSLQASKEPARKKVAQYNSQKTQNLKKVKTETEIELEKKVKAMQAAFAKLAGQPAEDFDLETANFNIGTGSIKRGDAIIDGFKELQRHKAEFKASGKPVMTRPATYSERKQFQFNPDAGLTPALQDFEDPMADFVYESPLEEMFIFDKADVGRDASTTVTLPTIYDDNGGASRLQAGQVCDPTPAGETQSSGRDVVVNPWHYKRQYCTRNGDFARYLDRITVAPVDSIPFEAMMLDALLNQLTADWALDVYRGGVSAGLLPQMIADAAVVKGTYTAADFAITTGNPVTAMEGIAIQIPERIRQMQSQFDLQWMGYADHIESFIYAHGQGVAANAPLSELVKPPLLSQAGFAQDWRLNDPTAVPAEFYQIVSPRENLRIFTSAQDAGLFSVRAYFNPETFNLSYTYEGHLGVGYAQSENAFLATGS